jgi:hypothetical protein
MIGAALKSFAVMHGTVHVKNLQDRTRFELVHYDEIGMEADGGWRMADGG